MTTQVISRIIKAFPFGRFSQQGGAVAEMAAPTMLEAATLLRHYAALVERGEIEVQRVSMTPRGRRGREVFQSFALWYSSIEDGARASAPTPAAHAENQN